MPSPLVVRVSPYIRPFRSSVAAPPRTELQTVLEHVEDKRAVHLVWPHGATVCGAAPNSCCPVIRGTWAGERACVNCGTPVCVFCDLLARANGFPA